MKGTRAFIGLHVRGENLGVVEGLRRLIKFLERALVPAAFDKLGHDVAVFLVVHVGRAVGLRLLQIPERSGKGTAAGFAQSEKRNGSAPGLASFGSVQRGRRSNS